MSKVTPLCPNTRTFNLHYRSLREQCGKYKLQKPIEPICLGIIGIEANALKEILREMIFLDDEVIPRRLSLQ